LLTGLKVIQDEGCGLPSAPSFAIEYPLEKSYVEIGKMIGMDWVRQTRLPLKSDTEPFRGLLVSGLYCLKKGDQ